MAINSKHVFLSLLSVLIFSGSLQAQKKSEKTFQLSLGADHIRLIDQGFTSSKLKFTGTAFIASMSYESLSETRLFGALLRGSFGNLTSADKSLNAEFTRLEIDLTYAKSLPEYSFLKIQNKVYAGVGISSYNFALENEPELENISITFYHTANLTLHQISHINEKNKLQLKVVLPVLGWVKRSAYDGGANQELEEDSNNVLKLFFNDSEFSLLNPLKIPRVNIAYSYRIAPKTEFTINYLFNYLHSRDPEPIKAYNNSLLGGFKFNF